MTRDMCPRCPATRQQCCDDPLNPADLAIRYTERLAEEGAVGSRGDSYDNVLAESVIASTRPRSSATLRPWQGLDDVEFAIFKWVDWRNNRRLLEPIGMIPPVEDEAMHYSRKVSAEEAVTQTTESP